MTITISGVTALDRLELEDHLSAAQFRTEDAEHGHADLGLFTIVVPLTAALVPILTTWLKTRVQTTTIEFRDSSGKRVYSHTGTRTKDAAAIAAELEALRGEQDGR